MGKFDEAGDAVRKIAGYLPYNPGPGIYSRLERAIEAMPERVRVQELPGLLKRYKDGVPGWELKATDLESVVDGRDVVPREELLARVKERSPVYTHKEVVLADKPPMEAVPGVFGGLPHYQDEASAIGRGIAHGDPKYKDYGQGGDDYTEILLTQPGARDAGEYYNHWGQAATQATNANRDAVAHARFDTHGDALRINELQSDLGIHNRKLREQQENLNKELQPALGSSIEYSQPDPSLPFPLEDAWADLLIKRLALEAARKGHRAIEVASPRAIADKVGGNIDNYEHFYGKVVPGALERLGRKMGGLVEDLPALRQAGTKSVWEESEDLLNQYRRFNQGDPQRIDAFNDLLDATSPGTQRDAAYKIYEMFDDGDPGYATAVTRDAIALAEQTNAARAVRERLLRQGIGPPKQPPPSAGRRYIMSDEMRRRIIEGGIGASVAAPVLSDDELIERLNQ